MKQTRFLFLIAAVAWVGGCTKPSALVSKTVIAKVGNAELTLEQAKADIPRDVFAADSVFALTSYRSYWINQQVWFQEATRAGFATDPAIQFKAESARNQMIVHLYRNSYLEAAAGIEITDADIAAFAEQNKKEFSSKETFIRVLHFKASDLKVALEAKNRLSKGEPIAQVVDAFGLDKEATVQESNRFVGISKALNDAPLLKQYLEELKNVGEISPIRRIGEEFHFVQLVERKKAGDVVDVETFLPKVREWLLVEKRRQRLMEQERNLLLRAKASGEIKTYLLPESDTSEQSNN